MKTIAFGPERDVPSWNWVGFDTSRELSKYYKVINYSSVKSPPKADVVVVVKQLPPETFIFAAKRNQSKVIYCPIDFFTNRNHLNQCGPTLRLFDGIVTHCERLNSLMKTFNHKVHYVDHNNKYMLPEMASYKKDGYILWIGGCQYTGYLLRWLDMYPLKHEVKILTDIDNGRAVHDAMKLVHELGLKAKITVDATHINGLEVCRWSERLQHEMMKECKAAIDVKGEDDFNQRYKPATKAQKYVASGIPFAINKSSYSYEYFEQRNFSLCSPLDTDRWLSEDYWKETAKAGTVLRTETSIEAVGKKFKTIIEKI
jgi:hypothetical protein